MSLGAKGSKDVFVSTHARWKDGKRRTVEAHLRSATPRMSLRQSSEQLTFDFLDCDAAAEPATSERS